jgi:hypothetical protein
MQKNTPVLWRAKCGANAPEVPSTKIQAPKKLQYSNFKSRSRALELGVSLELGAWNLELT